MAKTGNARYAKKSIPLEKPFGNMFIAAPTERDGVLIDRDKVNLLIAADAVKQEQQIAPQEEELTKRTLNARDALNKAVAGIGECLDKVKPLCRDYTKELGVMRTEAHGRINDAKKDILELRALFLGADYELEMARIKEYIDVCERLKALKDAGILDDVAQTLLKLK